MGAQFQSRHLQEGRRPWEHNCRPIFRRILRLDSKDSKYRNCNWTNSLHFLRSYVGKWDSKTKWLLVLIFHPKLCCWSKKWRCWFLGRVEVLAISLWKEFSRFWDAGRAECFCSEQGHPEFPVQKEGQPRGAESPKEDRFLRGRQIAFMIYDYFRVTGAHDTVLDYVDLFSVTLHDNNVQEFDTRWDEVYYLCQRCHLMMSWKACTHWGYVSLINSKPY